VCYQMKTRTYLNLACLQLRECLWSILPTHPERQTACPASIPQSLPPTYPGMMPSRVSGNANCVSRPHTRMSQASASSAPPPSAYLRGALRGGRAGDVVRGAGCKGPRGKRGAGWSTCEGSTLAARSQHMHNPEQQANALSTHPSTQATVGMGRASSWVNVSRSCRTKVAASLALIVARSCRGRAEWDGVGWGGRVVVGVQGGTHTQVPCWRSSSPSCRQVEPGKG